MTGSTCLRLSHGRASSHAKTTETRACGCGVALLLAQGVQGGREVTDAGRKRFCLCLPPRSLGLVCPLIGLRSQTRQADVPRRLVYTLLLQTHRCRLRCGRLSAHTDKTPRDELRTRLGESDTRSPPRNRPQSVSKCDTGGGETQATAV